jgi:FAD/FMN-containing dehydrogenase
VPNLEAARIDLIDALGVEAVLADPLALRLYARDASMVEGSAGLVVFVRSADDVVTCMEVAAGGGESLGASDRRGVVA